MSASDSFGKGGRKGKWFEAGKGAQKAMQTRLCDAQSDSLGKGGRKGKWFEAGKGAQKAMQTQLSVEENKDKKRELINQKADELKEQLMKSSLLRPESSESQDRLEAFQQGQKAYEDMMKARLNRKADELRDKLLKSSLLRSQNSESKTAGAKPRPLSGERSHGSDKQKPLRHRLTGKQRPPNGYPRGPVEATNPKIAIVNAQPGENPARKKRPRWCWEQGHHFPVPSEEELAMERVGEPACTDVKGKKAKEADSCNLVSRFDEEISHLLSRGEESGDIPADGGSGDQGGPLATEEVATPQGPQHLLESIVKGAVFLSETKDCEHPGKMESLMATLKAVDQLADWHWPATAGLGLGLTQEEGFEDFDKAAEDASAARKDREVVAGPASLGSGSFSFEALARGFC